MNPPNRLLIDGAARLWGVVVARGRRGGQVVGFGAGMECLMRSLFTSPTFRGRTSWKVSCLGRLTCAESIPSTSSIPFTRAENQQLIATDPLNQTINTSEFNEARDDVTQGDSTAHR